MKILTEFIKENKGLCFTTFLLLVLQTVTILLIPFLTKEIIDIGIANKDIQLITTFALQMVGVAIFGVITASLCTYATAQLSSKFGYDLRNKLFLHIQKLSLEDQKQYGAASLGTRSSSDVANIQNVMVMFVQMILPAPIFSIVTMVMSMQISSKFALVSGITILIFFIVFGLVFYSCLHNMNRIQVTIDNFVSKVREVFMGVKIIRAFDNSEYEEERLNQTFVDYADNMKKINRKFAFLSPTAFLLLGLGLTAILWFSSFDVLEGTIQIGSVTAVVEYVTLALLQLLAGALVTVMLPRAIAALNRIETVLSHIPSIQDTEQTKDVMFKQQDDVVVFDHVRFQYPGSQEAVLADISFKAKRGETLAIIGPTASGKSTIGKILMRFDDIQGGHIYVGGVDIKDMSQHLLRDTISYIPQTSFLFSGSIRDNITYYKPSLSDDKMKRAARIAQADSFIQSLDNGYESFVARGGTNYSGGQKQRICIARALAKPADAYFFDDSFSALDNATDAKLRQAIKEEIKDVAIIIVAQKINSIVNADNIIVLNEGHIVGEGTHKELLKNNSFYQDFAQSQQWEEKEHEKEIS